MEEMPKAKIKTRAWDAAEHLETQEDMAAYLEAALEEGDASLVAAALGDIARAKGMTWIATENRPRARESLQGPLAGRKPGARDGPQGRAITRAEAAREDRLSH
jgi:probable addiction module antidote protein